MWRSGDQIGPYTLISKLGRGAFGTVWLSERRTTIATTLAALKIPLDDDIDLETIKQEATIWVRASGHPNVLPIIEANIYDEQVIIVSEYAPDGSLASWLQRHGGKAPSVETAVGIISGILAGLEHLHTRNIIHRDLKPANILFQGNTPRLTDFGISRILETTAQTSIAAGTPAYMAPEAFDGKRSEQTDVWSMGVIFYELLTGRLPFPANSSTQLIHMILMSDPDPLPSSVPKPLQEVIFRALGKDTLKRYKSAAQMQTEMQTAVTNLRRRVDGHQQQVGEEQQRSEQERQTVVIDVPSLGKGFERKRFGNVSVNRWLKQEGDVVQAGDPVVELETDVVFFQIEAACDGELREIVRDVGENVHEGELLGVMVPLHLGS